MPLTGEELRRLRTMGVSWYVSYLYWKMLNSNHDNWRQAQTSQPRHAAFNGITHHTPYLEYVISGSSLRYGKNEIGLSGDQIIEMAREILNHLQSSSNSHVARAPFYKESSRSITTTTQTDKANHYPDIIYQINNALEKGCTADLSIPLISLDNKARDFFIIRMGQMKFNANGWEIFGRFMKLSDKERRLSIIWRTCKEMGIISNK